MLAAPYGLNKAPSPALGHPLPKGEGFEGGTLITRHYSEIKVFEHGGEFGIALTEIA